MHIKQLTETASAVQASAWFVDGVKRLSPTLTEIQLKLYMSPEARAEGKDALMERTAALNISSEALTAMSEPIIDALLVQPEFAGAEKVP